MARRPKNDPLTRVRRALETIAPTTHRPVTTGLHEAIARIFAGRSDAKCPKTAPPVAASRHTGIGKSK